MYEVHRWASTVDKVSTALFPTLSKGEYGLNTGELQLPGSQDTGEELMANFAKRIESVLTL